MSKLSERKNRHDPFHQKAKKEGFAARAIYKLEEIDVKHPLFKPGAVTPRPLATLCDIEES